jgi:hypothetical protein
MRGFSPFPPPRGGSSSASLPCDPTHLPGFQGSLLLLLPIRVHLFGAVTGGWFAFGGSCAISLHLPFTSYSNHHSRRGESPYRLG